MENSDIKWMKVTLINEFSIPNTSRYKFLSYFMWSMFKLQTVFRPRVNIFKKNLWYEKNHLEINICGKTEVIWEGEKGGEGGREREERERRELMNSLSVKGRERSLRLLPSWQNKMNNYNEATDVPAKRLNTKQIPPAISWERAGWETSACCRNQSDRRICRTPPAHELRKNNEYYLEGSSLWNTFVFLLSYSE